MSILERVCRCADENYGEPITAESNLYELEDSMGYAEFIMALEDEFDLEIPDAEAETLFSETLTVGQVAEWIERRL